MGKRIPLEIRFWGRLSSTLGGCLEFQGICDKNGYGVIKVDGAMSRTHRLAWEQRNGPIPEGLFVCHRCDNPPCCNVDHLFLGTPAENAEDRDRKGRGRWLSGDNNPSSVNPRRLPRGDRHKNTKLTAEQMVEIKKLYATGMYAQHEIASRFGVQQMTVSRVVRGKARVL